MRVAALLGLFAFLAPLHVATKTLFGKSGWPKRFLAAAAWILGARVSLEGKAPKRRSLLVANHTSWLDVLVLGGATGCAFVSKDQLGHPLIHWLADQNGTVYVKRTHRKAARDQALTLARALEGTQPVLVFPEGTTGPGTHLLAFHSTLLEAVNFTPEDVSIHPVAVDYHENRAVIGWYLESGRANILRILRRRGPFRATVRLLPPLDRRMDRKQLTSEARASIAQSLGLTSLEHSPIGKAE